MEQKWEFIKHTSPTKISYTGIHTTGIFITITITSYYINKNVGVFDIEKDENDKQVYINRLVDIGVSTTKEQWDEVHKYFEELQHNFMDGSFKRDEIRKFINERNYVKEESKSDWYDDQGRYYMDFAEPKEITQKEDEEDPF